MDDLVTLPHRSAMAETLAEARAAGRAWAARPLRDRLQVIGRVRRLIAREAAALAATVPRTPADTLVAEVLPWPRPRASWCATPRRSWPPATCAAVRRCG